MISGVLGFEYGARFYYLRPAFDPQYSKYSPGHIHIFYLIQASFSNGVKEFDFCRGDSSYKSIWTDRTRKVLSLRLTKPGTAGTAQSNYIRVMRRLKRTLRVGA